MRLSEDQIKQGILHAEQMVRDAALRYFTRSFSQDPGVMPLAIGAIKAHGWRNAFRSCDGLAEIVQSEETLLWLIDQLNRMGRPRAHEDKERCLRLSSMIAGAEVSLLMKHEQAILALEGLFDEFREALAERLRLTTVDTGALWRELEQFCQDGKDKHDASQVDLGHAFRLAEAIGRDVGAAERVLRILWRKQDDYEGNPMAWMAPLAARIAAEMRLEEALPLLTARLAEGRGDVMNEQCARAFVKVGTDAAVAAIGDAFPTAPRHFKLYSSSSLAGIHCPSAVPKALELLEREKDEDVRVNLIGAALGSFCTEGVAPARQLTLRGINELRRELVAVSMLMDVSFPELEAWKKEEAPREEATRRRTEGRAAGASKARPKSKLAEMEGLIAPASPAPIVGKQRVGRNAPCPCGSGRKYKKCHGKNA